MINEERYINYREKMYKLESKFSNQKSFYGKAEVLKITTEWVNEKLVEKNLFSYGSNVLQIFKHYNRENLLTEIEIYFLNGSFYYSKTTNKHKKEFLEQEGIFDFVDWNRIRNKEEVIIDLRKELKIKIK